MIALLESWLDLISNPVILQVRLIWSILFLRLRWTAMCQMRLRVVHAILGAKHVGLRVEGRKLRLASLMHVIRTLIITVRLDLVFTADSRRQLRIALWYLSHFDLVVQLVCFAPLR